MDKQQALKTLAAQRWQIGIILTICMMVAYFAFILLVAYNKELINTPLVVDTVTPKTVPLNETDLSKADLTEILKDTKATEKEITIAVTKKKELGELFTKYNVSKEDWEKFLKPDEKFAPKEVVKLTLGIVLGASTIVIAWILTGIYINWANNRYDIEVQRLRG